MSDVDKKKLYKLLEKYDDLKQDVQAMEDNHENSKLELKELKSELTQIVEDAKHLKNKVANKKEYLNRIYEELKPVLESYCSYLGELIDDSERDCELDWKSYLAGEIEDYEDFLESFIDHRKDLHLYKIKAQKLSNGFISNR